jgi:hypothetical protein
MILDPQTGFDPAATRLGRLELRLGTATYWNG